MKPSTVVLVIISISIALAIRPCDAQSETAHGLRWGVAKPETSGPFNQGLDLLDRPATQSHVALANSEAPGVLPNEHGQVWKEYDIRKYTQRTPNEPKPEQSIIDWILRETGTEVWFSEPLGLLSANRSKLSVYHTPQIQAAVADIVERFVRPETDKNVFGIRMVSVNSPNWRAKSLGRLRPVQVQTAGVEAWLLSREDAAVIMDELRKRTDFREYSSPNLLIRNGQTHVIQRTRPVAYVKGQYGNPGMPESYQPEMAQFIEGFTLKISPLLSSDKRAVDAVLKLEASQVERMTSINVPAPTSTNRRQMKSIQVPQTASWRLHERFRWPANQVLLISCGVVPSPSPEAAGGTLGLRPLMSSGPPRSDALIFVESKGRLSSNVAGAQGEDRYQGLNFRGRY